MNLQDAYTDFILSREAMNVTERTLGYYEFTLSRIINFLTDLEIEDVSNLKAFDFRLLLKNLREQNLSDSYIHQHARVSKTFLSFLYKEGYIPQEIDFELPKIASKHLRVLEVLEIQTLISCCEKLRDKLIILLFVDTGIRLNELCMLDWSDKDYLKGYMSSFSCQT